MATYVIENSPFLGVTSLVEIETGEVIRSFTGATRLADCVMYAHVWDLPITDDPGNTYPEEPVFQPVMEGEHPWR